MALGRGPSFAQRGSVGEGKPEISSPSTFDFSFYNQLKQHTPGFTYSAFVMEGPPCYVPGRSFPPRALAAARLGEGRMWKGFWSKTYGFLCLPGIYCRLLLSKIAF